MVDKCFNSTFIFVSIFLYIAIGNRKFKQWWSTILPISTTRTTTSNTKHWPPPLPPPLTPTNQCSLVRQLQKCTGIKPFSGIPLEKREWIKYIGWKTAVTKSTFITVKCIREYLKKTKKNDFYDEFSICFTLLMFFFTQIINYLKNI